MSALKVLQMPNQPGGGGPRPSRSTRSSGRSSNHDLKLVLATLGVVAALAAVGVALATPLIGKYLELVHNDAKQTSELERMRAENGELKERNKQLATSVDQLNKNAAEASDELKRTTQESRRARTQLARQSAQVAALRNAPAPRRTAATEPPREPQPSVPIAAIDPVPPAPQRNQDVSEIPVVSAPAPEKKNSKPGFVRRFFRKVF